MGRRSLSPRPWRCSVASRPYQRPVSREWWGAVGLSPQGCTLGTELSSPYGFHTPWSHQGGDHILELHTLPLCLPSSAQDSRHIGLAEQRSRCNFLGMGASGTDPLVGIRKNKGDPWPQNKALGTDAGGGDCSSKRLDPGWGDLRSTLSGLGCTPFLSKAQTPSL